MLTMFLSAVCASALNVSVAAAPADTLDRYVIDGAKVENFDGSQLVGKTVSDYKILTATGKADGKVVRVHMIRTDERRITEVKTDSADAAVFSAATVYILDGRKCDKDALNKIKPASIASMTVYKPGSKEAVELSGRDDVAVIQVVTK